MQVHASIFKAYDIRGVVGQTLNEEVAEHVGRAFGTEAVKLVTIDGLRVEYADGFGLVRPSNTIPVLVLRFEGHTPKALERIQNDVLAQLKRVKPDATFTAGH